MAGPAGCEREDVLGGCPGWSTGHQASRCGPWSSGAGTITPCVRQHSVHAAHRRRADLPADGIPCRLRGHARSPLARTQTPCARRTRPNRGSGPTRSLARQAARDGVAGRWGNRAMTPAGRGHGTNLGKCPRGRMEGASERTRSGPLRRGGAHPRRGALHGAHRSGCAAAARTTTHDGAPRVRHVVSCAYCAAGGGGGQ